MPARLVGTRTTREKLWSGPSDEVVAIHDHQTAEQHEALVDSARVQSRTYLPANPSHRPGNRTRDPIRPEYGTLSADVVSGNPIPEGVPLIVGPPSSATSRPSRPPTSNRGRPGEVPRATLFLPDSSRRRHPQGVLLLYLRDVPSTVQSHIPGNPRHRGRRTVDRPHTRGPGRPSTYHLAGRRSRTQDLRNERTGCQASQLSCRTARAYSRSHRPCRPDREPRQQVSGSRRRMCR